MSIKMEQEVTSFIYPSNPSEIYILKTSMSGFVCVNTETGQKKPDEMPLWSKRLKLTRIEGF